jgi:aryl-alcohol dehydrogenase-like predicted oxidoreductase
MLLCNSGHRRNIVVDIASLTGQTIGLQAEAKPMQHSNFIMTKTNAPGSFMLGDRHVSRMGYGAMQLAGPRVFGPPKDRDTAIAVLREAVERGVNHIDTSDYYGPHVTNQLTAAVHDNLRNLHVDVLDVVNLRTMLDDRRPVEGSIAEQLTVLAELQQRGLIWHLGLSNVTAAQVEEAQSIAPVVCVQNMFNVMQRHDGPLVDALAQQDIAYVPFFPLAG